MTAKADRVRRLLEDSDLQEAFENVRDVIYKLFEETPPSDKDALQRVRMKLEALEAVKANLERAIEDGKLEDFRAQEEERNVH